MNGKVFYEIQFIDGERIIGHKGTIYKLFPVSNLRVCIRCEKLIPPGDVTDHTTCHLTEFDKRVLKVLNK